MVAFFCSTPYQILLAINIRLTILKDKAVDIYVLNHFQESEIVVNKLISLCIFNKVEHVNCLKFNQALSLNICKKAYERLWIYTFYRKIVERFFQFEEITYDDIYLTCPDIIIHLAIKYLWNRNRKVKIHIYEDGTGGYCSSVLNNSIKRKLFNRILGQEMVIDRYDSILVFRPELYSSINNIPIVKIPDIDPNNRQLTDVINVVFGYKDEYKIDEDIIFLETPINFLIYGLEERLKAIAEEVLIDNYIVKLHPRSTTELYSNFNLYKNSTVPWEVICLNNNVENKILMSFFSTAQFSSKIIFDQEPAIILLFNLKDLIPNNIFGEDEKRFVHKFYETYRDKSKIFIPESIDELRMYLSNRRGR